jgi:hypothetical protein
MLIFKLIDTSKFTLEKKNNAYGTTAGTGSGYEQAQGYEL